MLVPAPAPAPYLDRLVRWLAPRSALRRAHARAALAELEADRADPSRVTRIGGERWRRVEPPPGRPSAITAGHSRARCVRRVRRPRSISGPPALAACSSG